MKLVKITIHGGDGYTFETEETIGVAVDIDTAKTWVKNHIHKKMERWGVTQKDLKSFSWDKYNPNYFRSTLKGQSTELRLEKITLIE